MAEETTEDNPTTVQKFAAELLGTFVLVFFGCSAALGSGLTRGEMSGYIVTGLTFGLTVVIMAYAVGRISGGHFNPAVTLGAALGGRLAWRETPVYFGAQFLGGILASLIMFAVLFEFSFDDSEGSMAQNAFGDAGSGVSWWAALIIELLCTAIFIWVILAITDTRNKQIVALAPLGIGLTLAMIHFGSMYATGTSVNPARSLGPALFAGTEALKQVWLFFVGPLAGAAIAGITYPLIFGQGDDPVPGSGLGGPRQPKQQFAPQAYEPWGMPGTQGQDYQQAPQQQWGQPQQHGYAAPAQPGWGMPGEQGQPYPGQTPQGQAPYAPQAPQPYPPTAPPPAPQSAPQSAQPTQQTQAAPYWEQPQAPQSPTQQPWGQQADDGDEEDGRTQVRRPD